MAWVTQHPPQQVDLDSCVTCGLCLPVCPTFRLTGDETASPRGRIAAIAAVADGRAVVDTRFDEITGFCLQCRACETVCPSMVPYGHIIEAARSEAVAQVSPRGSRVKRFALARVLASPVLLRIATMLAAVAQRLGILGRLPKVGPSARGLRRLPLPVPTARGGSWGTGDDRVIVFAGCVADTWFPALHAATIEVLVAAGYRVESPADQTCCGALAAHGGFDAGAERMARRNVTALSGDAPIVVDVAGCGAHLDGYGSYGVDGASIARRTTDVTKIVAEAITSGRLPTFEPTGTKVAIQDPCHLEHGQGIVNEPRLILEAAGYDVVDADRGGLCCGAAGVYQIDHPDVSETLGERKADKVRATGAVLVASANAGCEMQLRKYLDDGISVAHPVEMYAERMHSAAVRSGEPRST